MAVEMGGKAVFSISRFEHRECGMRKGDFGEELEP
jgi:hypothetical protein